MRLRPLSNRDAIQPWMGHWPSSTRPSNRNGVPGSWDEASTPNPVTMVQSRYLQLKLIGWFHFQVNLSMLIDLPTTLVSIHPVNFLFFFFLLFCQSLFTYSYKWTQTLIRSVYFSKFTRMSKQARSVHMGMDQQLVGHRDRICCELLAIC